MSKLRFSVAALAAFSVAAPASAAITVCSGGGCAPQPHSNVLVNGGETGSTVNGTLNNGPGTVAFSSSQTLASQANGQARVGAATGGLTDPLDISFTGGLMSALEFNLNALTGGTVSFAFSGGDSNGFATGPLTLRENGSNFFNVYGGSFDKISISFGDNASLQDIQQVRLAVAGAIGAVPEPATWALMILGFGAIAGTMRRRRAKTTVAFAA